MTRLLLFEKETYRNKINRVVSLYYRLVKNKVMKNISWSTCYLCLSKECDKFLATKYANPADFLQHQTFKKYDVWAGNRTVQL